VFDWNDRDIRSAYRMRWVIMLLLFILLGGSFSIVAYLHFLGPDVLPLGGYYYLLSYSFGLRLVYLTPGNILATHLAVTPQTVFLVAVFVTSWVLIVALSLDFHFLRFLVGVEECERYGDAKALVKSFTGSAEGRAGVITALILLTLIFLFLTALLLSTVMMYGSEVRSILSLLASLTLLLYIVEWLTWRKRFASFVQRKIGDIKK